LSRLKQLAGEKAHTRSLSISTYPVDEKTVLVEGTLIDNRFTDFYLITGGMKPPGIVHNLVIGLLIEGPELVIRDLEVEMIGVPKEECIQTEKSLEPIIGLKIVSGFTNQVKNLIGGVNSCIHLVSLLLAMAPAALQGYWACTTKKKIPEELVKDSGKLSKYMINSCWVWREDGPEVRKIMKFFKN